MGYVAVESETELMVVRCTSVTTPGVGRYINGVGEGLTSQVTELKDPVTGKLFWTREALCPPGGWGMVNSGMRNGLKHGRAAPADWPQVLELAVDRDLESEWERIAGLVKEADRLGRSVVKNGRWTPNIAIETLKTETFSEV